MYLGCPVQISPGCFMDEDKNEMSGEEGRFNDSGKLERNWIYCDRRIGSRGVDVFIFRSMFLYSRL